MTVKELDKIMFPKINIPEGMPDDLEKVCKIEMMAESMVVDGPERFSRGAEVLAIIKNMRKKVVDILKPQKQEAKKVHSQICDYEGKLTDPLDHAEEITKAKMVEWMEQQKELEEIAIVDGETLVSVIPDCLNIGFREGWKADVIDEASVPRQFLSVDKKKLADFAKQTKGVVPVKGVDFNKTISIINNS